MGQSAQSEELGQPSQGRLPPASSLDTKRSQLNTVDSDHSNDEKSSGNSVAESNIQVIRTPNKHDAKQHTPIDSNAQSPAAKEYAPKKMSIEIARPRGIGPAINLMDSAPGQLLPPPDSRKVRKMAQQAQPEPSGSLSPPLSPDPRFSSDFSSKFESASNKTLVDSNQEPISNRDVEESIDTAKNIDSNVKRKTSDPVVGNFDSKDGFEPPKLLPRSNKKSADIKTCEPEELHQSSNIEVAEVFIRRSSSVRRGERPRYVLHLASYSISVLFCRRVAYLRTPCDNLLYQVLPFISPFDS